MCFCIHKHTHAKCTHLWEVLGWGGELVNSKLQRCHNIYPPTPSPSMRRRLAAAWSYLKKYLIFISICCMIWSPSAISWHRHLNAANSWIERGRDGLQRTTIVMIRSRVNPFCTGGWEDVYFFFFFPFVSSRRARGEEGEARWRRRSHARVLSRLITWHVWVSVSRKTSDRRGRNWKRQIACGFFVFTINRVDLSIQKVEDKIKAGITFVLFVVFSELKHSTNY